MVIDFIHKVLENKFLLIGITFVISFCLVSYLIPKIIFMVKYHKLSERPGERSSHTTPVPTMGGLAFFVSLIVNLFLLKKLDLDFVGLNLAAAITLIFIVGLKDDLAVSTPKARIIVEIIAVSIIFFNRGFHSGSFDGFIGMTQVPSFVLDLLYIFIALAIINAYNLIDGVDGLSSCIGISVFSMFGLIFYKLHLDFYFLLTVCFIGMLAAFLMYNFSHKRKIFMGDTGSLIIGFTISFLSLKFLTLQSNVIRNTNFNSENELFIIIGLLAVPFLDMLRVIMVRLLQKQSPFVADKNHVHHILLDFGLPHYKIALLLATLNYSLAILIISMTTVLNSFQMVAFISLIFIVFSILFYYLKISIRKKINL